MHTINLAQFQAWERINSSLTMNSEVMNLSTTLPCHALLTINAGLQDPYHTRVGANDSVIVSVRIQPDIIHG